ncbi:MAG: hypothetical protein M1833_003781 [Piccolia ochrophora]|nr:MAG: hypothetical protein M1833_003781 [Piccolia ochrophora]
MALYQLPPIISVPSLSTEDRAKILDQLFEPCTPLHTLSVALLHDYGFESYEDMIAKIAMQLTDLANSPSSSDTEWLHSILGAHPRLGAKKIEGKQSQQEQAQLHKGADGETAELTSLNEDYEKAFPGTTSPDGSNAT